MAGFQVAINGRFWVATEEVSRTRLDRAIFELDNPLVIQRLFAQNSETVGKEG